jgi:hypothetical protein
MLNMLRAIAAGALPPQYIDGDYGEYSFENLTILLPMKKIAELASEF